MKVVLVVDRNLPRGLQANAAAALGLSLGAQVEGLCGPAVADLDSSIRTRKPEPTT